MPGNYINIDANFPTFTGRESSREQIQIMMNYIRSLVDQLRYTLNNLDAKNFNQNALDSIIEGGTENIAEQIQTLAAQLQQTNLTVGGLASRVGTAEGNITNLQGSMTTAQADIGTLKGAVAVDPDTGDVLISSAGDLAVVSAGSIAVGESGIRVDIDGDVYINGTPQ